MMGCCHSPQLKYRDEHGETTENRLNTLADELSKDGLKPAQILYVKGCQCPCHRDGVRCMC